MTALVVIAKACVPGRVKTRLHPPFTLEAAARIAAASLADTLETAMTAAVDRRILYFDGDPDPSWHDAFEVVPQRPGTLDERIAVLFDMLDEPSLLIGMDTPQVSAANLSWPTGPDAVIGMAEDGGFWALGMREPRGDVIRGVPMSRADTGERQLATMLDAGLDVAQLNILRDVDTAADARAVAAAIPDSRFARALAEAAQHGRAA
ncbi:TIGR04282 family arsenosugar biosynthesis glycosyltransferase [Microbacterium sulfonylureivorans]|uniref:TIGR04282 family arsenosugar biosynthesis glycosyltransferase n=1 Tax=Microbacterium sulfonylureivorans TaxID=2486854 RepID=UPI000FD8223A|nr:DUF2064 domain-containing protein [Microbacterium sulfonylureivorans]